MLTGVFQLRVVVSGRGTRTRSALSKAAKAKKRRTLGQCRVTEGVEQNHQMNLPHHWNPMDLLNLIRPVNLRNVPKVVIQIGSGMETSATS